MASDSLKASDPLPHASFAPDAPPDLDARRAALEPTGSFAVSAPAGSGKTGLLTQRVLTLLAHSDEPEEVLAITFTRKAAGEMQDRLLQALWQANDEPEPDNPHAALTWRLARAVLERDRQRQWQLLLNPQRLRIQTIDSLCRAITRQLPLESRLGAQPDTLDDPDEAYRQAVRALFERLEQEDPLRDDLIRLLRHLDNNLQTVEALLVDLLAKREQWLAMLFQARSQDARTYLEAVLRQINEEHLTRLTDWLRLHESELCAIADRAAENLAETEPDDPIASLLGITGLPACEPEALPDWQALAALCLNKEGQWRKSLTVKQGFPRGAEGAALKERLKSLISLLQEEAPEVEALLHGVRSLPPAHYSEDEWQFLDSLTRLLPYLAAQLKLVFKRLGATDYSEIAQAANLALGHEDEPSDIALKLDYQIRHILVDEFQDTSSPQLQLLQKLTAGWQPDDGRTLFIVGDGMQSCYRFRDANVGLFLDAREQGIGQVPLTKLDLRVNFRSQAGVVQWVNRVFEEAFPPQDDIGRGAVCYSPSIAFNEARPEPAVRFYGSLHQESKDDAEPVPDASPDKTLARLREAESVAHLVQTSLQEHPEDTVAVLVRSRRHLEPILPALARAGLRWQATEIDSLASRMAILDLMSLTRALLYPDDRIAWLSILRAPWCGLDLHDLHRLVTADLGDVSPKQGGWPVIWQQLMHRHQIDGLSPDGQACLDRFMAVLEPAWRERQRKPLRTWIEGIWVALGGPATLLETGDQDNIPSYFSLLESHQQGGSVRDWPAFESGVKRLYAAPSADADPRLQVMTLHKSKGLEFDTVIIPGLDRASQSDSKALLLWQEHLSAAGERQLLLGPLAPAGKDQSGLYQFMRQEADRRRLYEDTRLLYVGCTRAAKRLHLLACLGVNDKTGEPRVPGAQSLLRRIWEPIREEMQTPPAPLPAAVQNDSKTQDETSEAPSQSQILRLPARWQAPEPHEVSLLDAYRGREYDDEENLPEPETRAARLARHTGTVLHNQLQRLTEVGIEQYSEEWAAQQSGFWALQLRQLGWRAQELEAAVEKIRRGLQLTLEDPDGRWVLDPNHAESQCELALLHEQGGRVRESIIDRTFKAEGRRWIIDYKSSTPEAGQSLDAFINAELENYQPQLTRYAQAMAGLEESNIVTALYFPLLESDKRLWCLPSTES